MMGIVSNTTAQVFGVRIGTERVELSKQSNSKPLENALAETSQAWISKAWTDSSDPVGVVATGGDTALALCRALGTNVLWPEGEVTPGIPWSRVETENGTVILVSKAGGFGEPESIHDAVLFLMKRA